MRKPFFEEKQSVIEETLQAINGNELPINHIQWYKVLDKGGRSCNGGEYKWRLPKDDMPSKLDKYLEPLQLCYKGYHLTWNPTKWIKGEKTKRIFKTVVLGSYILDLDQSAAKCVTNCCALTEEVTDDNLLPFGIVDDGVYEVADFELFEKDKFLVRSNNVYFREINGEGTIYLDNDNKEVLFENCTIKVSLPWDYKHKITLSNSSIEINNTKYRVEELIKNKRIVAKENSRVIAGHEYNYPNNIIHL